MNSLPKYVVSTTLERAETWNATIINGNVGEKISSLKQQPRQDILLHGYGQVTDILIQHDLLDQLRIWLHPVLVGSRELDDLMIRPRTKAKLKLAEARQLRHGPADPLLRGGEVRGRDLTSACAQPSCTSTGRCH